MQRLHDQLPQHGRILGYHDMLLGAQFLDIVLRLFKGGQLGVHLWIDLGDDRLEIQEKHDPPFHLDEMLPIPETIP